VKSSHSCCSNPRDVTRSFFGARGILFVVRGVAAFVGFSSSTTSRRAKTVAMKSSVFVDEFGKTNPIGEQSSVHPEIVLSTTFAEIMFTQLAYDIHSGVAVALRYVGPSDVTQIKCPTQRLHKFVIGLERSN
jgi:hypothetical protein